MVGCFRLGGLLAGLLPGFVLPAGLSNSVSKLLCDKIYLAVLLKLVYVVFFVKLDT